MRSIYILCILFWVKSNLSCQKHDYTWLWGYDRIDLMDDSIYGTTVMDFNTVDLIPRIYYDGKKILDFTFASGINCVSDSNGMYQFSFNGEEFENFMNKLIKNSQSLYNLGFDEDICWAGGNGGLIIPNFNKPNSYLVYFMVCNLFRKPSSHTGGFKLIQCEIDMSLNNGEGEMINKGKLIYQDTLDYKNPVATRHANGRDWWLILTEFNSNHYHIFLSTPDGVKFIRTQEIGESIVSDWGQSAFSSDGSHYVKCSADTRDTATNFVIFDFDRCSGELSNYYRFKFPHWTFATGCSFSPNSKYLYIGYAYDLYQVDLTESPYKLESVIVYDSFIGDIERGAPYENGFGFMEVGPDGKVYNCPTYTGARSLNIIEFPNKKGFACNALQHSLKLPTPTYSMPVHPNYRLGPIDGSVCDSLDINNYPVAEFRYKQDTTNHLKIEFTDLSYYEPTEWYWDFGDPSSIDPTSTDTSPIHIFSNTGIYNVCLKVKNANGENSICKDLQLGTVATKEPDKNKSIVSIYPNPVKDRFNLMIHDYLTVDAHFVITNQMGQEMFKSKVYHGWNSINIINLPNGVYYYSCYDKKIQLGKGKLIKIN